MAKTRTLQEINNDYFQTAAMLGDLTWKVVKFTGDDLGTGQIGDLMRKLRTIDNEMDAYQKEQEKLKTKSNGVPGLTTSPQTEAPQASPELQQ